MRRILILLFLISLSASSCVDDDRYYDQGKDDAWKGEKNVVLYIFNKSYRSGYDEAKHRAGQASDFSESVKKAGDEIENVAKDIGRSLSEFWKDLTE